MLLTTLGVVLGLARGYGAARLLGTLLFGVGASDAATYIAVALLLVVVALLANLLPARRAAAIDPMSALRFE